MCARLRSTGWSSEQARALVDHLSPRRFLPDRVVDQIIARTDGIPLFLEEMTQAVIESERAVRRQNVQQSQPPAHGVCHPRDAA